MKSHFKVAILDLYAGHPNQGMRGIQELLDHYRTQHNISFTWDVFDVRGADKYPGTDYDIYISTGGPGSPVDSVDEDWDKHYFQLIEQLWEHNESGGKPKKFVLFICHSFQLMCRHYGLGTISKRKSTSFGIFPMHRLPDGTGEPLFNHLPDPFYAVDSRDWQVTQPNQERLEQMGATLLAIEKERPHIPLERAIMAIRFSPYFFGTQFHPEADPIGMDKYFHTEEKKKQIIEDHGEDKYNDMLEGLADPNKILLTQGTIIPQFLDSAFQSLMTEAEQLSPA